MRNSRLFFTVEKRKKASKEKRVGEVRQGRKRGEQERSDRKEERSTLQSRIQHSLRIQRAGDRPGEKRGLRYVVVCRACIHN